MLHVNFAGRVGTADKVVSCIDVLGAGMPDVVFDVIKSGLGVGFDESRTDNSCADCREKMTKEFGFFCSLRESDVFGFHGGERNGGLFDGLP